jgi:LytS/YehU family sensor histidine kinase
MKNNFIKSVTSICLFLFLAQGSLFGQNKLDSLINSLKNCSPKNEIECLQNIATYHINKMEIAKAIPYNMKIVALARAKNDMTLVINKLNRIGNAYNMIAQFDSAILMQRLALTEAIKINDLTLEAAIYGSLSMIYANTAKADSSFYYTNKSLDLNLKRNDFISIAENYMVLAHYYANKKNDYKKADEFIDKAIFYNLKSNDRKGEISMRIMQIQISRFCSNTAKSIKTCLVAIDVAKKNNIENGLPNLYAHLAIDYANINEMEKAEDCLKKAELAIVTSNGAGNNLDDVYSAYGHFWAIKKNYSNELKYRKMALEFIIKSGTKYAMASALVTLVRCETQLQNYQDALQYAEKCKALCLETGDKSRLGMLNKFLGVIYRSAPDNVLQSINLNPSSRYSLAIEKFNEALPIAIQNSGIEYQKELYEELSTTYEMQGDYVLAYETYRKAMVLKDSILNDEVKNKINRIEVEQEYSKKEDSLKLIQTITRANLAKEEFLNKQQQQNILLQDKEILLGKQQLTILNNDKELQHLAYLKTQADLQTVELQKSESAKRLTLLQQEKLLQSEKLKTVSQSNELNKIQKRQTILFSFISLASLGLFGIYFFNRNRHKQKLLETELIQQKLLQQQKEAEFQKNISDASVSALRSQMNPHFIFNCLNSIKLYTTQNNNEAAANYLTKFSKLIRMALENSRSETITLKNDLDSLELYIQLEAMRFKEKLKYTLLVDKNVDTDFIEVPPMLLQPYVENSIWHGLMHKEEGGCVDIHVSNNTNDLILTITIKDNGVGREKAAALSNKKNGSHNSIGTKATQERIQLINKQYSTEASVTTEDVISNHNIAGTLVTLKIPYE